MTANLIPMVGIWIKVYSPERIRFLGRHVPARERLVGLWLFDFDDAACR